MPSEKVLTAKKAVVSELSERIKASSAGVLVSFEGLTVEEDTKLRKELRKNDVQYEVVKNTLLKLALKEAGFEAIDGVLNGTTALATAKGESVAPAKVLCDFAKDNEKLVVKAGYIEGETLDAAGVVAISKIPSKEGLLSQVLFGLNSPITKLAYCIQAIVDKQNEGAAPAEEAAPAEAPAEA